jgi:hypothetical protein
MFAFSAVADILAVAAIGSASLTTITPTKAEASEKTITYDSTHNVPSSAGITYYATNLSSGTLSEGSSVKTETTQTVSGDTKTYGGSHLATLNFKEAYTDTGSSFGFEIYANNIRSISYTYGAVGFTYTQDLREMSNLYSSDGGSEITCSQQWASYEKLPAGITVTYSIPDTNTYTYSHFGVFLQAFNYTSSQSVYFTSITVTWKC